MIVIDASVAIKWFVLEAERERSHEILNCIKRDPANFAVPDFFFLEMMSVLGRLIPDCAKLEQIIDDLFSLGMLQVRLGAKLLKMAARFSVDFNLSGYDALYASCAESLSGTWITADRKAHRKIASLKISKFLME